MQSILRFLPDWMSNKYFIVTTCFVAWMLFLDQYNLFTQWERRTQILNLERQIRYYDQEILKTNEEKNALFGNLENLEKFARETYWMKRDNEDLFILYNE